MRRAAVREHQNEDAGAVDDAVLVPLAEPRRRGRRAVVRPDLSWVDASRRRRRYVEREEGAPFGVRHRYDEDGRYWADLVAVDGEAITDVTTGFRSPEEAWAAVPAHQEAAHTTASGSEAPRSEPLVVDATPPDGPQNDQA